MTPFDPLSLREQASSSEMERVYLDNPIVHAVMSIGRQQGWNDLDTLRTCVVLLANYSNALFDRLCKDFQTQPPSKELVVYDEAGQIAKRLRLATDHPFAQLGRAIMSSRAGDTTYSITPTPTPGEPQGIQDDED